MEKNKSAPEGQVGKYDFYFQGESVGIDNVSEVADYAETFGFVEKTSQSWYQYEGQKINGKAGLKKFLRENPDVFATLTEKIYEQFG